MLEALDSGRASRVITSCSSGAGRCAAEGHRGAAASTTGLAAPACQPSLLSATGQGAPKQARCPAQSRASASPGGFLQAPMAGHTPERLQGGLRVCFPDEFSGDLEFWKTAVLTLWEL